MAIDLEVLWHAVSSVVSFFLIGYLGYCLAKRGWFTDESSVMLSRMVASVIIPINLLYNINTSTTKEHFLPLMHFMFLPAAAILLAMAVSYLVARWAGVSRSHRNIFINAFSCSNTINIGLPINLALFGVESIPAILIYYMGNTVVFWSIGNYLLASDAKTDRHVPVVSLETAKQILSPPIRAFLAGLVLLLLNVRLPDVLADAGRHVAAMTTPLSIICIGIAIFQTGFANMRLDREMGLICLGRFVIGPLILIALLHFFPVPPLMRNVFIIQASLPPMSNIALLSMQYKTDSGFAAMVVSFATLCSLVTIPVFMVIISS